MYYYYIHIVFDQEKTLKINVILYLLSRPYCAFVKISPIVPSQVKSKLEG
jgi:hypothetical protein